jgi:hypothetical protein
MKDAGVEEAQSAAPLRWKTRMIYGAISWAIVFCPVFLTEVFIVTNPLSLNSDQRLTTLYASTLFGGLSLTAFGILILQFEKHTSAKARTGFLGYFVGTTPSDSGIVLLVMGVGVTLAGAISLLIALGIVVRPLYEGLVLLAYIPFGSVLPALLAAGLYRRIKARVR